MNKSYTSANSSEDVIKIDDSKKSSEGNLGQLKFSQDVELVEDGFGIYYDEKGVSHNIKRFTWKNKNKIQVQVINFGARITSIKMPDRMGNVDDIVLGFDDLAGYIHYKNRYFGATIGRMSNMVQKSTFQVNNKQHFLTPNRDLHHYNGGRTGLDQIVWTTFVDGNRVIMSHVSPHMNEGYPGHLLITITFELSARNEFHIKMEAQTTHPTIVNLSNLTYFNLGGHHSSSNEVYRHVLTVNSNCFTPLTDGMPTGAILNVVHSAFDFQIPKVLGKVMGIVPKDGFNQNLCINRGMHQDDCFVARVLHPPTGRLLELYSNQWGVNFSTANDFGYETIMTMDEIMQPPETRKCEGSEPLLRLYEKVHKEIRDTLASDEENTYKEIYDLIKKMKELSDSIAPNNTPAEPVDETTDQQELYKKHEFLFHHEFEYTKMQLEYLNNIVKILCDKCDEDGCEELKGIIEMIISVAKVKDDGEHSLGVLQEEKNEEHPEVKGEEMSEKKSGDDKISVKKSTMSAAPKKIKKKIKTNSIPEYYLSANKIVGKDRAHYKTHGGIALQTQNYPGCENYKNFPNCVLKPGETYVHITKYKFWIRSGNPNKWIKRNLRETKAHFS